LAASNDLLAPKEASKSDADLRGPKELVKSNSAAGLSSTDPLAALKPGSSESKDSNADAEKSASASEGPKAANAAPAAAAASTTKAPPIAQHPEPEMDFPARVVHLKIENDNLRSALDKLESEP
jgi:hypothetical protein